MNHNYIVNYDLLAKAGYERESFKALKEKMEKRHQTKVHILNKIGAKLRGIARENKLVVTNDEILATAVEVYHRYC